VDGEWGVVRFRAIYGGGLEAVAVPVPGGLEVSVGQPGEERTEEIAGVSAVWSASPCSLLIVDRRLRACGQDELGAVRLKPPYEPEARDLLLPPARYAGAPAFLAGGTFTRGVVQRLGTQGASACLTGTPFAACNGRPWRD